MKVLRIASLVLTISLLAPLLSIGQAQRPQPQATPPAKPQEVSPNDVIRVDTELVTLTATVTDQRGRYVANLKQFDFTVYEDGVKQGLAYFNTGDRVPMSLGIVFDTSGSMIDKIDGVKDAVEHFVKSVAAGDEIFLVQFSDGADIVQDFTDDRRRILRAVERLEPQGSTALYDAVLLGLQRVTSGKHRKRGLLLLTDGNDTASSADLQTALAAARKAEVTVYGLGIGHGDRGSFGHDNVFGNRDTVDMRVLRALADATGGNAYFLESAHEGGRDRIDEAATEVALELKQQYTLGYYPSNKRKDGALRQIQIEMADKSLRVRTKRGYYAPSNQNNSGAGIDWAQRWSLISGGDR
ncbi:MAG: VWA domain-containing protein [Pyrinomonadaceae bacterium]